MISIEEKSIFQLLDRYKYNSPEIYLNEKATYGLLQVFIYSSGKTASTSIFESLKQLNVNCMHVHSTKYYLKHILKMDLHDKFHLMNYINHLTKTRKDILVIDIIREPIGRKMSSFFQHIERLPIVKKDTFASTEEMLEYYQNNIDELIDIFNSAYLLKVENYYGFNEYVADGLNIFDRNFNHSKKRMLFKHNNKKYLLIRFDDLKKWNNIFDEVGFKGFTLTSSNQSEDKKVGNLYKLFKKNYYISEELLNRVYLKDHKKVLEKFYTAKERSLHYKKWKSYVK